jgi:methylmalonyl-CoA mutase, N-terminal domain
MSSGDWKEAKARWLKGSYEKTRAKSKERQEAFATSSGIQVEPVYTPETAPESSYLEALGFPGEFPFTRGVQPTMYRGRHWTMRQYAGFGTAEDANTRYHYLLKSGQTGLSVAFDLPTQMGRDADHARARGEVGKVGVSISSVRDMEVLLRGLPLGEVSTSMTINATASILLCLYAAVAEKNGVGMEQLSGTVQNDVLKHLSARAVAPDHHRPVRVLRQARAALEPDLHQRVPHPRGRLDGGSGDRLHAGGRHHLRRRRAQGRAGGG